MFKVGDEIICTDPFFTGPVKGTIKSVGNGRAMVMFHHPIMHFIVPISSLKQVKNNIN